MVPRMWLTPRGRARAELSQARIRFHPIHPRAKLLQRQAWAAARLPHIAEADANLRFGYLLNFGEARLKTGIKRLINGKKNAP
jgi:hypothetical protein